VIAASSHAHEAAIRTAITAVAAELAPAANAGWRFVLPNGAGHTVTAEADDDWLRLEADCPTDAQGPESFWEMLSRNASLPGLAKAVLADDGGPRLRAEIPLLDDIDLTARVREACRGFEQMWAGEAGSAPVVPSPEESEPVDLKALCSAAGWPYVERSNRKLAVELEVAGGFSHALLRPVGRGVNVSWEIATLDSLSDECRQAVGGFLLAASGLVRMGRASVNTAGSSPVAQFVVIFGTPPSPSEISNALESLSVGCSLCGEEIKMLQAPAIAERYLALRGWSANRMDRRIERTPTP
jgi:hypothetical protein